MELFGLAEEPLDADAQVRAVSDPESGAVVTFLGVSRATSPDAGNVDRPVETLWYEAYGPMALKRLRAIGREACERFDVRAVSVWHRTGEVPVGEASVAIAVASAHRASAFEACRWSIEEIKRSVPIWKRERFADGEEWVVGYGGATGPGGEPTPQG